MIPSTEPWTRVPAGWKPVSDEVVALAKERALAALADEGPWPVSERLAAYYDEDGDYVGASFANLHPNDWSDVTASDLHATSLMGVDVGSRATRRMLSGPPREVVLSELRKLPDVELLLADDAALEAMYSFYMAVKGTLANPGSKDPNPWVTASKLCARKRCVLFPVRDRLVCDFLGIRHLKDVRGDWLVFRALIQDVDIRTAIANAVQAAKAIADGRQFVFDDSELRLLDAAMWTYARRTGTSVAPDTQIGAREA